MLHGSPLFQAPPPNLSQRAMTVKDGRPYTGAAMAQIADGG
jgi:hypothetical protein